METVLAPNTNVVRGGLLIGFITTLGSWNGETIDKKEFEYEFETISKNIEVVGTPQMVCTNLIMITHVNKIVD